MNKMDQNHNEHLADLLDQIDATNSVQEVKGKSIAEPIEVGCFEVRTINDWIQLALTKPMPDDLWGGYGMFLENEVTCLFSDSGVGKTILAVQIGEGIAKRGKNVLYVDYELSDTQFTRRYVNNGYIHRFPETFYRCEQSSRLWLDNNGGDPLDEVIQVINNIGADAVIIDNLSWISEDAEEGDVATLLMRRLCLLKRTHEMTIIVIAHTPKRIMDNPITQNDLGGSKKLMNFMDSAVAIGRVNGDDTRRYIKHVKCRTGENKHGSENVLVCRKEMGDEAFLKFVVEGTARERDLLKSSDDVRVEELVMAMDANGATQSEIASQLRCSQSKVSKMLKKIRNNVDY